MLDEYEARRPEFVASVRLRMADGRNWWLPPLVRGFDAELDAQLSALIQAEDREETGQSVLAIMIVGLARNYDLAPAELVSLLSFGADEKARDQATRAVLRGVHDSLVPFGLDFEEAGAAVHGGLRTLWTV
ncbi:MAG: hypothetical protein AB7I30_18305 [Isosphaeraceae bacterium]